MATPLNIAVGQYSDKGLKAINQDFHGVYTPAEPLLSSKGICIAIADGISSSHVSQDASKITVTSFFEDYYSTSEAWTVKTSAQSVLHAINSWLYAQTQRSQFRYDKDKGYVCTFSGMIVKSSTAHLFHAGDSRIYRRQGDGLEQLTRDHRVRISDEQSYLGRALGADSQLELDYKALSLEEGDVFVLMTDGVYEFVNDPTIVDVIKAHGDDLDLAAKRIADIALNNGSDDNLTIQIARVDSVSHTSASELLDALTALPFPPSLDPRMDFDGYRIIRQLYASARSHVYLARDEETHEQVVVKTLSTEMHDDAAHLERFLLEEWIARRINSANVLKPCKQTRKRHYLYIATEYIEGQTLSQWMIDHPKPDLQSVREIIKQIANGLHAFHRLEMLHQDLRPENIMIDQSGTVKIIDFGSALVSGLNETNSVLQHAAILGTAQYTAPEYFLGEHPDSRSDLFSLGVITYQMLCGKLPYGTNVAKSRTRSAQKRLTYRSVLEDEEREIPAWVDDAIRKAVHPNPLKRYDVITEFLYDLQHPNQAFVNKTRAPLMERNPVAFWQAISCTLAIIIVFLLISSN